MRVGQAFEVPVEQPIDPVIKLGALDDEAALAAELNATVVTPLWEGYLDELLHAYVQSFDRATSDVGIWISGYFGAGKSHLAKVILLALANRRLGARPAAELLLERVAPSARRRGRLGESVARLGEVSTATLTLNLAEATGRSHSLGELLLAAYYRSLGYGDNLLYARVIEAELDQRGKLAELHRAVAACAGRAWSEIRGNLSFYSEALYQAASELVPERFSSPEQVTRALAQAESGELRDVGAFVRTALGDLERRERACGHRQRLLVVLDEAGAWIGSDGARLGELGALCEQLASAGRGRAWLGVVTHGDLETVGRQTAMAADSKTIESRFRFRFDLTSENLGLVLEERLLRKTPAAERELRRIYAELGGALRELGELGGATRPLPACDETRFVRHYPLLPYHAQLVPEIVRTLRARAGREVALAPSTRTLLGVVQDVLRAGRRPHLELELGALVGLDEICANLLASGELGPDAGRELERVRQLAPETGQLGRRVAEILLLLDCARFVPRSEENVARLLGQSIEDDLPTLHAALRAVLGPLERTGVVARVGGELELVTGEARVLEAELAAMAQACEPAELRQGFAELCREVDGPLAPSRWLGFQTVSHAGRAFGFKVRLDGASLAGRRGDVVLAFFSPLAAGCDSAHDAQLGASVAELEAESLRPEARHWVLFRCPPSAAFERALARLLALRQLCRRWQLDPARSSAEHELAHERQRRQLPALGERARDALARAMAEGVVVFRGSSRPLAPREGEPPGLALRAAMVKLWPAIYPRLDRVAVRVSHEAESIRALLGGQPLRDAELGPLGFVDSTGRIDPHGPLLGAIRMLVRSPAAAGASRHRPLRGRELLAQLAAPPYGWDASAVRVGVAALVRLGALQLQLGAERLADPARAELAQALTQHRTFAAVELHAGHEATAPEQLTEARALLVELGQPRALEETAAAVGEAALRVAAAELAEARVVRAWCEGLGIPADRALAAAAEVWQAVHDAPDAGERVARVASRCVELRGGHAAIERCAALHGQAGSALAELLRHGAELRAVVRRLPERGACARWLDALELATRNAQLLEPGALDPLAVGWARARVELDRLVAAWRQDARSQLDGALGRLGGELARAGLDPARAAEWAAPLHGLRSSLEAELSLGALADLPAQATSLIRELGLRLVCAELGLDPAAARHLRPTDLSTRTTVHSLEQWEALKAEIDACVRRWLASGELVVLD